MKQKRVYLGVDIGSVSSNFVLIDEKMSVLKAVYIRTKGNPLLSIKRGMSELEDFIKDYSIPLIAAGAGVTGSGRKLTAVMLGMDAVKNEITAHGIAALNLVPEVRTILEIGGQDSKLILIRDGIITDFSMNTVCAAGTGSFLDRQAERLEVPIEAFGDLALLSDTDIQIAGRCVVFAETDMIHKQQMGYNREDIIKGLCNALVRNYLTNLAKGKKILGPVVFQGGVAANKGIKKAFEEALGQTVCVPEYHMVMGAIGAAILAMEAVKKNGRTTFKGFGLEEKEFRTKGFECDGCANRCEVLGIYENHSLLARWGDRCGKWSAAKEREATSVVNEMNDALSKVVNKS